MGRRADELRRGWSGMAVVRAAVSLSSFSRDAGWLVRRDCLRVMRLAMSVRAAQVIRDSRVPDEPFVVPGVSAGVHDPGQRAFDDPAGAG